MRLSEELQKDLVARLETIAKEAPTSPAFRDLPRIDRWAIGVIFAASIGVAIILRWSPSCMSHSSNSDRIEAAVS